VHNSRRVDKIQKDEDVEIQRVSYCNYLGVTIDEDLKWTEHIESVYKKRVEFTGIFCRLTFKLPTWCLRNIYYSYVQPHIHYGIGVYAHTHSTHLDKLIKVNNKLLCI
jgi:hypothetical protein